MRSTWLVALPLVCWVSGALAAEDPAAAELKKLEGVWECPRGRGKLEITVTAQGITGRDIPGNPNDPFEGEFTFTLGQSGNTRTLDGVQTKPTNRRGQKFLAIYTFEGEVLKLCSGNARQPRPADFVGNPGAGKYLMVFKRKKP